MKMRLRSIGEKIILFLLEEQEKCMSEELSPVFDIVANEEVRESISFEESFVKMAREGGDRREWIAALETLYGKELISRIHFSLGKERFEKGECLEHLSQLGHAITLEDVDHMFQAVKRGGFSYKILSFLQASYFGYCDEENILDLKHATFTQFVDLFRDPLKLIDPEGKSFSEELHDHHLGKTFTTYDHSLRRMTQKGIRSRPEFPFASRELLARKMAYIEPRSVKEGALVPIFNHETQKVFYYQVKGQIHNRGLHCCVLVPLSSDPRLPVQLIFRGTSKDASIHRDLDPSGVGKKVFDDHAGEILKLLEGCKNHKIEVIGHSLGAADAQRAIVLLTKPNRSKEFQKLTLFAYCSPKLDHATVNQWRENLKSLPLKTQIYLNFAYHKHDIVTITGDVNISKEGSPQVHPIYFIVRSQSGMQHANMHHTVSFFKDGNFDDTVDGREFKHTRSISRKEHEDEVAKLETLDKGWWWLEWLKRRVIKVETREEIHERIERLCAEIKLFEEEEKSQIKQSKTSYILTSGYNYTVLPAAYHGWTRFNKLWSRWR